jgi:hypothetical protein
LYYFSLLAGGWVEGPTLLAGDPTPVFDAGNEVEPRPAKPGSVEGPVLLAGDPTPVFSGALGSALCVELPAAFCARAETAKVRTPTRPSEAHDSFERVEFSFMMNLIFDLLDASNQRLAY